MENLNFIVNKNIFIIIISLAIINIGLLVYLCCLKSKLGKLQKKYDFFTQKSGEVNIDDVLTKNLTDLAEQEKEIGILKEKHKKLREQVKGCVQTVKVVRYDAFDSMGGEMSYSLLLADEEKNGVILTSIYGREENRCYAKDLHAGKSNYILAEEEQKLL